MASRGKVLVGEVLQEQAEGRKDAIKRLIAMSDEELMETMGLSAQVANMKDALVEADTLSGKARDIFNRKLAERMRPRVDASDFGWMKREAEREASPKAKGADGPTCC